MLVVDSPFDPLRHQLVYRLLPLDYDISHKTTAATFEITSDIIFRDAVCSLYIQLRCEPDPEMLLTFYLSSPRPRVSIEYAKYVTSPSISGSPTSVDTTPYSSSQRYFGPVGSSCPTTDLI
jgi:hypothetical protein